MDGWIMELDSHLMLSVMLLGADVSMAAVGQRIKKQTYKRIMSVQEEEMSNRSNHPDVHHACHGSHL